MTRFAMDPTALLEFVRHDLTTTEQLVAPTALRSHTMSLVYREVRAGQVDDATAKRMLDGVTSTKIRLLGDRVSRARAWRIATDLGLADTTDAEYLAVTQLQADALVTFDSRLERLARRAGIVVAALNSLIH